VLSKEVDEDTALKLELESVVQVLIRKELLEHEAPSVRILMGLCCTTLFQKIGFEEVVDVSDPTKVCKLLKLVLS